MAVAARHRVMRRRSPGIIKRLHIMASRAEIRSIRIPDRKDKKAGANHTAGQHNNADSFQPPFHAFNSFVGPEYCDNFHNPCCKTPTNLVVEYTKISNPDAMLSENIDSFRGENKQSFTRNFPRSGSGDSGQRNVSPGTGPPKRPPLVKAAARYSIFC